MTMAYRHLEEVRRDWRERRTAIERRLRDFRRVGLGTDRELFAELAFCLFAIQTSARRSDGAVRGLTANGLLWRGSQREIAAFLRSRVRFHNHKAAYLVAARDRFFGGGDSITGLVRSPPSESRQWLIRTIDGIGHKEASHFLRNVGRGEDFAILDRHILKNLVRHGVIRGIPTSLTDKRYLAIEERVRAFADDVRIPMAAIDLIFWSRETGEVFK
ncbi:MAG: DNA lyase [Candidatus Thermoplasmatota archaeon]